MLLRRQQRRGTILIESALVYPILFLTIFAILMLSLAVFRHQQASHIAREAARWASVRGAQYAAGNAKTAATPTDIYDNVIKPYAISMDLTVLNYSVTWADTGKAQTITTVSNGALVTKANTVTVQITYAYPTKIFGTFNLTSTSVVPMSY